MCFELAANGVLMKRLFTASILGLCLSWLLAGAALGYDTPIGHQITLSGTCADDTLTATVVDSNGKPLADQVVSWAITTGPSSGDMLGQRTSTSDHSGVATNTIQLDGAAMGTRVITAKAGDAAATITLGCLSGGLPRTDTAPTPGPAAPLALFGLAGLVMLMGVGIVARRARG